jgi:AbrB family looped-hinge helix DNA binding protein
MTLTVPFHVKAVKIGNSIRMTIPKEIADYLKIGEGSSLELTVSDHTINVKKVEA